MAQSLKVIRILSDTKVIQLGAVYSWFSHVAGRPMPEEELSVGRDRRAAFMGITGGDKGMEVDLQEVPGEN